MSEWRRTILLVILLAVGLAFLLWTRQAYQHNFTDTLYR
jgi:hypothetical protein